MDKSSTIFKFLRSASWNVDRGMAEGIVGSEQRFATLFAMLPLLRNSIGQIWGAGMLLFAYVAPYSIATCAPERGTSWTRICCYAHCSVRFRNLLRILAGQVRGADLLLFSNVSSNVSAKCTPYRGRSWKRIRSFLQCFNLAQTLARKRVRESSLLCAMFRMIPLPSKRFRATDCTTPKKPCTAPPLLAQATLAQPPLHNLLGNTLSVP